ncbi:MAG TPA: T9SS type A sorting domain-containing protein, partial [Flavitalea sp.]|nr:T9SS type A sorting domain-containing protein [Flavitalea sp.]
RNLLRWKTDLKGKGLLSVSVDSGFTWKSIKDIADLESNATEWYPEPGFYSAKLKIQTTGKEFVSPTFRVSSPIKPHVILNCSDSAVVNWKRIPGISKYEIFKLPGKYLEPAVSTSDSFFVLNNDFGEFIAVAPVIDDSTGQRGFTQNVNSQSAGCYSNNLLADLQDYGDVIIRFEAGTVYRVAAISLERSSGNSYIEIEKVVNPSQVHFEWIDKQAKQGLSFYRVKITLNNSQEIYSEVVQVTNAGKHDFLFFPVPVKAGQPLSILSASPDDAVLFIYDVFGRTLLQKNLYERIETIRIHQPGTYFYQVQMAGKRVKTGKLVVN